MVDVDGGQDDAGAGSGGGTGGGTKGQASPGREVKSSSSVVAGSTPSKGQGQGQGRAETTSFGLLIEVVQGGQGHWTPLSDNLDYQLLVSAESTADQEDKAKGERQRQLGKIDESDSAYHTSSTHITSSHILA